MSHTDGRGRGKDLSVERKNKLRNDIPLFEVCVCVCQSTLIVGIHLTWIENQCPRRLGIEPSIPFQTDAFQYITDKAVVI